MAESPDWYLHRKNCASCAKALAWLESHGLQAAETVDARRHRYEQADALELVSGLNEVWVARGKNWHRFDPSSSEQLEAMLNKILGPHGTLRAPAMRFGQRFVVGFHEEMLDLASGRTTEQQV